MIDPEQVQAIALGLAGQSLNDAVIVELRIAHPNLHFTYCMDDDIPNQTPVLEGDGFNLYLIDGREHCLCLTRDYANATGVVVAEVITD